MKLSELSPDLYKFEEEAQGNLKLSELSKEDYQIDDLPDTPSPEIQTPAPPSPSLLERGINTAEDTLKSIGRGASFGLTDELAGGVGAVLNPADSDKPFIERYKEYRDRAKADAEMSKERSPLASTLGEVGGAIASSLVGAPAKATSMIARGALEGAAYGLGESDADLTEGEFAEAVKDTGLGAMFGGAVTGGALALGKGLKAGYSKAFGQGQSLAADAAGDILELTPKQRADASKSVVKLGPGKTTNVAEELPSYLREQGGFVQSMSKLKNNSERVLGEASNKIEDVLNRYEEALAPIVNYTENGVTQNVGKDIPSKYLKSIIELEQVKQGLIPDGTPTKNALFNEGKVQMPLEQNLSKINFAEEVSFKFKDLADKLTDEVAQLRGVPGFEGQLKRVDKYIDSLRNYKSPATGEGAIQSIKELHKYRRSVDKLIKSFEGPKSTATDALFQEALMKTRREMSNHLQNTMLGRVKEFAEEALKRGDIPQADYDKLITLQDELYKANRDYKMATFVNDQIGQAMGRKDARRLIGLTDIILGTGATIANPAAGLAAVAGKKTLEVIRPRAQLYSKEIGEGVAKVAKTLKSPAIQQFSQMNNPYEKIKGTKYDQVFKDIEDPHQKAVRYNVLFHNDSEFRDIINKKEE